MPTLLTVGEMSKRTGVAASALRFYESEGLITSSRTEGGQRRFERETIRRISFARVAQEVGLSLREIRSALDGLPGGRVPNARDWKRLSTSWRPRLQQQIDLLVRLRDQLDSCIGCGCLSLQVCKILNPGDVAAKRGQGPRALLEKIPATAVAASDE
jgi:MerR family redox-sensitive transcriptional activator SoxR